MSKQIRIVALIICILAFLASVYGLVFDRVTGDVPRALAFGVAMISGVAALVIGPTLTQGAEDDARSQ